MQFLIDFVSFIFTYIKSLFNAIPNFFDSLKAVLVGLFQHLLFAFLDILLYIPRIFYSYITDFVEFIFVTCNSCGINYIYQTILTGIRSLQSISTPNFINDFNFSACIAYLSDILSLNAGFQLLVCAFLFRFAIRRIPLFG